MRIKHKNGEVYIMPENDDDASEEAFYRFVRELFDKREQKTNHIWCVEYHDGEEWITGMPFKTREEARKEARIEQIRPTRVQKYTRSLKG